MRYARRRLRAPLILIAGLALLCAGAVKWRRYGEIRRRIASYAGEEKRIMDAYYEHSRIRSRCGNERIYIQALLSVATERRRLIEECEREIRRIW